jgi:hypothetical protein
MCTGEPDGFGRKQKEHAYQVIPATPERKEPQDFQLDQEPRKH